MKTREIAYGGLSIALLAICSWISIPFTIPFTLQTLAMFLICLVFGGEKGTIYVFVYIIAGAIGLPVFSGFRGGIGALMNLTGGYILGFLWSSLFLWLTEKYWINNSKLFILCSVIGLCLCYSFGTYWFLNVSLQNQNILSVRSVLSVCVFLFIIPDLIKIILAYSIGRRLRSHLP